MFHIKSSEHWPLAITSKPVLSALNSRRSYLYVGSTARAAFAVLIEPVSAKGLFHCFLDHPLPKALLHELLPRRCGWQVFISEVTQFICGSRQKTGTGTQSWDWENVILIDSSLKKHYGTWKPKVIHNVWIFIVCLALKTKHQICSVSSASIVSYLVVVFQAHSINCISNTWGLNYNLSSTKMLSSNDYEKQDNCYLSFVL